LLLSAGTQILKYYLDIDYIEQVRRLEDRRTNPLKQWKVSPIDQVAVEKWDDYSAARNDMLLRTNFDAAPWHIVRANDKRKTRLNVIRHILSKIDCPDKDLHQAEPDDDIVFQFKKNRLDRLAP
jgi:polyphosphate kinase 2 (PPK2 family)